ncbi:MAG: aminopeptidase [Desulfohalobiaceae bacterium]|nr:aminopeptidase [Desulfohalobiaceae bacterium]
MTTREKIFAQALQDFAALKGRLKTSLFGAFGSQGLNNAYIMLMAMYHKHFPLFEKILEEHGNSIKKMLADNPRSQRQGR